MQISHLLVVKNKFHKIALASILCLYSSVLFSQSFPCGERAYLVKASDENSSLWSVNWNEGNPISELITQDLGVRIDALGYRTSDQFLYGLSNTNHHVYQIRQDGSIQDLGVPNFLDETLTYHSGAITPSGNVFAVIGRDAEGIDRKILSIRLFTDPLTSGSTAIVSAENVRIEDMAFDPIFGNVLGYDSRGKRMVNISYPGGVVTSAGFENLNNYGKIEGVFFDEFGQLLGYGGSNSDSSPNALLAINKANGQVEQAEFITTGSQADACACPYRIRLEKKITPNVVVPCSEVEIEYIFHSTAGANFGEITLLDELPSTFEILNIEVHSSSGDLWSGVGTSILDFANTFILLGQDTLRMRVNIGEESGIYTGQATLEGFPAAFGIPVLSDDFTTLPFRDPTILRVIDEQSLFENEELLLCPEASMTLIAPENGLIYTWSDGSTDSELEINMPGEYWLEINGTCGTWRDTISVIEQTIPLEISLGEDQTLPAGTTITLFYETNAFTDLTLEWSSNPNDAITCTNCDYPKIISFHEDVHIQVNALDEYGCTATDELFITLEKERPVFAPTAFSPNGDGLNDMFYLQAESEAQIIDFQVFNRWGAIVFAIEEGQINSEEYGWNGLFAGQLIRPDVYIWRAEILYADGFRQQLKGDVLVVH